MMDDVEVGKRGEPNAWQVKLRTETQGEARVWRAGGICCGTEILKSSPLGSGNP